MGSPSSLASMLPAGAPMVCRIFSTDWRPLRTRPARRSASMAGINAAPICAWSSGLASARSENSASRADSAFSGVVPAGAIAPVYKGISARTTSKRSLAGMAPSVASTSSALPMSISAIAAWARSLASRLRSRSASVSLPGPFSVVFQTWMFSAVGFSQPANDAGAVRHPSSAQPRSTPRETPRGPRAWPMPRTRPFSQKAMGCGHVRHARIRASRKAADRGGLGLPRTSPALPGWARSENVRARMFPSRDPRRRRRVRGRAVGPRVVLLMSLLAGARTAGAVPIDDPDIGGIGFSGPTSGDLAAVYWNPAALGLIHGGQLTFGATGRLTTTTVTPAGIDPATGLAFQGAKASDFTHPFSWPPGPGAFAGVGADVGGDRFTLAFATYMPFADRSTYQNGDSPNLATRYHRISADLRNLALVPALAVRFAGDLHLDIAPGFLFSAGRLSFDETTCGVGCAQDPSGDARYNIASSPGFQTARFALTLGGGLYYRTRSRAV